MWTKFPNVSGRRVLMTAAAVVVLVWLSIVTAVFSGGHTLGQRCVATGIGPENFQWAACLQRMARAPAPPTDQGAASPDAPASAGTDAAPAIMSALEAAAR